MLRYLTLAVEACGGENDGEVTSAFAPATLAALEANVDLFYSLLVSGNKFADLAGLYILGCLKNHQVRVDAVARCFDETRDVQVRFWALQCLHRRVGSAKEAVKYFLANRDSDIPMLRLISQCSLFEHGNAEASTADELAECYALSAPFSADDSRVREFDIQPRAVILNCVLSLKDAPRRELLEALVRTATNVDDVHQFAELLLRLITKDQRTGWPSPRLPVFDRFSQDYARVTGPRPTTQHLLDSVGRHVLLVLVSQPLLWRRPTALWKLFDLPNTRGELKSLLE